MARCPAFSGASTRAVARRSQPPQLVTSLIGLLAAALPLESLAAATASVALSVFALVHVSLVVILRREARSSSPAQKRRLPLAIPVLGAITSLGLLAVEIGGRLP